MLSDGKLVESTCAGNRDAYGELVKRYERAVYAVALEVLNDFHAAQDVAQDAFLVAYEKLGTLRKPAAFGAWLLRIARRLALRSARRHSTLPPHGLPPETSANPNHQLDDPSRALLDAVMRLPLHERQVIMLHYFESRSVRAVAEIVGRPVGTVTKQLSRARNRLARML